MISLNPLPCSVNSPGPDGDSVRDRGYQAKSAGPAVRALCCCPRGISGLSVMPRNRYQTEKRYGLLSFSMCILMNWWLGGIILNMLDNT